MRKVPALITLVLTLVIAGCGKEPSRPKGAQQSGTPAPAATEQSATPQTTGTAAPPGTPEQPQAATEETTAAPVETVTETEDREAAEGGSQVQPALRLGGASGPATSSKFAAGTHYQVLVPAQPTSAGPGKVEVVEVFWYGCGHCYELDPAIESWRTKGKPPYVQFSRIPAMWNESTRLQARVFYTAEALGKLDELHSLIFREVHVNGDPLNSVRSIAAFFKKHGVSAEDFEKTFSGFAVEAKLQRAQFLNQRYRVDSVPVMVVNGKYTTGVGTAGSERNLFTLIDELAAHEHGG